VVAEASNTTVAVLRGVKYDEYGDLEDAATEVTSGIPAILAETSRTVQDPATQQPRTVRAATLKVPYWTQILDTDQVRDEFTGAVYAIEDITTPPTTLATRVGGAPDLLLTLRRVTGTGP
jgi:hypothetical protein